jgi:cystathionine gamma-lyase
MPSKTAGHSTSNRTSLGFATRAIWDGQDPYAATEAIRPSCRTATLTLPTVGENALDGSRSGNPTLSALEKQLSSLEDARFVSAFGSGMAAIAAVTGLLSRGDHIVATRDLYGGTRRLFATALARNGITTSFVDMRDLPTVMAAMQETTRLLWVETPSNPTLKITDIAAMARLKRSGQMLVVDNTLATPYFQRPLSLGGDIVVYSATKYLCGDSEIVGGVVITNHAELHDAIAEHQNTVGAIPGPWDSYLTLRGAKTLALRMGAHERQAQSVADFLNRRFDVAEVFYPGLRSHPQHKLARRQMSGYGGIISFRPRGGSAHAYVVAKTTRVFRLATSLGGVESLICHPASMTHASLPPMDRVAMGVTNDLLRLSVGIENLEDMLADLDRALDGTGGAHMTAGATSPIEWR